METFLECETKCREPPPRTRIRGKFGENRSKESGTSGASYTWQKTTPLRPIFCALSETHSAISLETCKASTPPAKFHPNPSKCPRFISENDVSDRYNNRRADRRECSCYWEVTVLAVHNGWWITAHAVTAQHVDIVCRKTLRRSIPATISRLAGTSWFLNAIAGRYYICMRRTLLPETLSQSLLHIRYTDKKAVLLQGIGAMPQLFFSV